MIAAKHQSFLDIILIFGAVPAGKFIMKRELLWTPILGQYALRIGCIPVDRGKRGAAIKKMVEDVGSAARRSPASSSSIRRARASRRACRRPTRSARRCSMTSWARTACRWRPMSACSGRGTASCASPGVAVVEFLPRITGRAARARDFMARLETEIEGASDALMAEAGFVAKE